MGQPQARVGDMTIGVGSHGVPDCPHVIFGVFIQGSQNTLVNGRPNVRVGDLTAHSCPHCPVGMAVTGSSTIVVNGRPTHRLGDVVTEFCGVGVTITGSQNTLMN